MVYPPTVATQQYNKFKWGVYGELGDGAGVKIRFIQTAISPNEFETIKLVPEIPGSEQWDVRDLFQREIDSDRVGEIMAYLKNPGDVKFFSPLVLVIVPMNENKTQVLRETTTLQQTNLIINNESYISYERSSYFKINVGSGEFAQVEWNDKTCNVVAIDGQHRLDALKRLHAIGDLDAFSWKVPIVLLTIEKTIQAAEDVITILETVRRTFVNINEKSEHINECRKILLDDESVNSICVQELVEVSHKNDNLPFDKRDTAILPLVFYEWQGIVKNRVAIENPAAVLKITEVKNWLEYYLLKSDGSEEQKTNLRLADIPEGVPSTFGEKKILNPKDSKIIREYIRNDFVKGLNHFLINLSHYKKYIEASLELEKKYLDDDQANYYDVSKHAYLQLRFGRHSALETIKQLVDARYVEIKKKYEGLKNDLPGFIGQWDIGMRGVIAAFGALQKELGHARNQTFGWVEFSMVITPYFNQVFEDGWFIDYEEQDPEMRELLTYVMFDEYGGVKQYYKLETVPKMLGSFIVLAVLSKIRDENKLEYLTESSLSNICEEYKTNIEKCYEKGFKDKYKSENRDKYVAKELNTKATEVSKKEAAQKIVTLMEYLKLDDL